jgi:hypothetical protein
MRRFQATTWREGDLTVAQCLDVDIASQGGTAEEALANLRESLELFFEAACPAEIEAQARRGFFHP